MEFYPNKNKWMKFKDLYPIISRNGLVIEYHDGDYKIYGSDQCEVPSSDLEDAKKSIFIQYDKNLGIKQLICERDDDSNDHKENINQDIKDLQKLLDRTFNGEEIRRLGQWTSNKNYNNNYLSYFKLINDFC